MAVRALYEAQTGGLTQLLRHFHRHGKAVGHAPNAISAEQLSCFYHDWESPDTFWSDTDLPYLLLLIQPLPHPHGLDHGRCIVNPEHHAGKDHSGQAGRNRARIARGGIGFVGQFANHALA